MWNNYFRPVLEAVYFIASIGLVAGVWIGINQLKLFKIDMHARYKRAAVEKSIEYLNWFATEYIPKSGEFHLKITQENIPLYKGPYNTQFRFDEHCNLEQPTIANELLKNLEFGSMNLMNELEYFSAALIGGLADEELTFNPLARTFCNYVEKNYVTICYFRLDETSTFYSHLIGLYTIWKARLNKMVLENKRSKIDADISKIQDRRIRSIGG